MMGGSLARTRVMLLQEGISFYELEEKASRDEFLKSPCKSMARFIMSDKGISVQDLKKGTIYEALEAEGLSKEEIEKQVKDMAEESEKAMYDGGGTSTVSLEDLVKRSIYGVLEQKRGNKEFDAMKGKLTIGANGIILTEEALKDTEMFPDANLDGVMTKRMKKAARIEKKNMLKKKHNQHLAGTHS